MPSLSLVRQIVANVRRRITVNGWFKEDDASVKAGISEQVSRMHVSAVADILAELILRVEKLEKGD